MPSRRRKWVVGAVTALEAGCLVGVASLGRGILAREQIPIAPRVVPLEIAGVPFEGPATDLEAAKAEGEHLLERVPIPQVAADRSAARKESEYYSAFIEVALHEPDAFVDTVRGTLGEGGPACRKIAALRALCDIGSPAANEVLSAAVLELPDLSSGHAESIPGFALRRLSMRAPRDAGARRALEGLVFGPSRPGSRLRAAAAFALCSSADESELDRIGERLRSEPDELVVSSAETALDREFPIAWSAARR